MKSNQIRFEFANTKNLLYVTYNPTYYVLSTTKNTDLNLTKYVGIDVVVTLMKRNEKKKSMRHVNE